MSDTKPTIAVIADDLIWASRLAAAVERAGAKVVRNGGDAFIVDLNGRAYDGLAKVAEAAAAGRPTIAVGQHEDVELRRRALAAGAVRVYSYNRFFREGPALVEKLLAELEPVPR
jgi:2,4-dienoyl-CoA reductase-like NADH-dependent reductase (Old Yellow Enzyme family)